MNQPFFKSQLQRLSQQTKAILIAIVAIGLLLEGSAQAQSTASPDGRVNNTAELAQPSSIVSTEVSTESAAEKVKKLEAAAATVDTISDGYSSSKIKILRKIAEELSELGEQNKAIKHLQKAQEIASQDSSPRSQNAYPQQLAIIASSYISIGEIETAETLLKQAFDLTVQLDMVGKQVQLNAIAQSYGQLNDTQKATEGFAAIIDYIARTNAEGKVIVTSPSRATQPIIEWYGQSTEREIAEAELSRLLSAGLGTIEVRIANRSDNGEEVSHFFNRESAILLSQVAKAYAQQNNEAVAKELLTQAMDNIRDTEEYYVVRATSDIAAAYEALSDTQTATSGLTELEQLIPRAQNTNQFSSDKLDALKAIAIAYSQTGNTSQAQTVATSLAESIQTQESLNTRLQYLYQLADLYEKIGDITSQQAVYQQMFSTVAPVTLEYSLHNRTLNSLLDSYAKVNDEAIAQENFEAIKALIQQSEEHYNGVPNALGKLAIAAQKREQFDIAQQLLSEATEFIASDNESERSQHFYALYIIAEGYGTLPNEQTKQTGFETIRLLAKGITDPDLQLLVESMVTRTNAGLGPWL